MSYIVTTGKPEGILVTSKIQGSRQSLRPIRLCQDFVPVNDSPGRELTIINLVHLARKQSLNYNVSE